MILNLKQNKKSKTEMVSWRGGEMEFATETCFHKICQPPWYVIKLTDKKLWASPWYYWIDYLGVPQIFLTKKMANIIAKQLREQYECKVEVVEIEVKL
jgi:hypothetical protein